MTNKAPLLALLLLGIAAASRAQVPDPAALNPSEDVSARMSRLEAETQALQAQVRRLRQEAGQPAAADATPAAMEADPAAAPAAAPAVKCFSLDELKDEMKKLAWKKGDFTITPYGFLWGNVVNSSERTYPGSYTLFVLSPSTTNPADAFIVDDRNTRLGFDVLGPRIPFFNCAQSGGKVEIDFQQAVLSTENKPTILLRHAYVEVKDDDFRLLAGQTWDVISPLYPSMLMYSVGWDAGDIGYRRAQVRGERYFHLSDTSLVTAQLSINQDVFPDEITGVTGVPSNWPIVEGRVAWTIGERGPGCLPVTIGVSGHIGEDEFDVTGGAQDNRRRTWSGNVDVRVPLTERLGVQGEVQVGENLSPFLGGIGQGIDPTGLNTIRDAGGWFEVWYDWSCCLHSHVGYSVDDPNDHDLHTVGDRTYNQFYFGNLIYDLTKQFLVGVEVSSWKTLYLGELPGDSVRCEFVAKYGF